MVVQLYNATVSKNNPLTERFERKFYIVPEKVGFAYGLLRQNCLMDGSYPSEQINSLYFDTADLDQHERSTAGDYIKDKVRLRWYGRDEDLKGMQTAFLELKSRRGFASTKQRYKLQIPADNLALNNLRKGIIAQTLLVDTLARFGYFLFEPLVPVVKISYWRYRFSEVMTGQRISLDCHIRSTMMIPGSGNGEIDLELPGAVMEIKGRSLELPALLRPTKMLDIDWTRFSKYSSCIDSHGEEPGTVGYLSPSGRIVWQ